MKKQLLILIFTTIATHSNFITSSECSVGYQPTYVSIRFMNESVDSELVEAFTSFQASKLFKELEFERFNWKEVKRNHNGGCFPGMSYATRYPEYEKTPGKEEWYVMNAWRAVSVKHQNQITISGQE